MGAFTLLVRHFFGRFFDNEIVVAGQRHAHQRGAGARASSPCPAMFAAFSMLPQRRALRPPVRERLGC